MRKRIKIPAPRVARSLNRRAKKLRQPTPSRISIFIDAVKQIELPTLHFTRHYPRGEYIVPPLAVPLYWFDSVMIRKHWILPLPPDKFVVDGRRFIALAQDQHTLGSQTYTRWLVYEEAAVGRGNRP